MKLLISILCLSMLFFSNVFSEETEKTKEFNTVIKKENVDSFLDKGVCDALEKYCISIFSVNPGLGKCSGVVVKKGETLTYILTAKHCINTNEEMYVEDNKVITMIVSATDDLALLIIEGNIENKEAIKLSNRNAKKEETLYLIGYPSLIDTYKSVGKVLKYTNDWGFAHLKVIGGCSGGGIFTKDGKLVGIIWGGFIREDIGIFEPVTDIKRFLGGFGIYGI